jgi:tight adherence protein C
MGLFLVIASFLLIATVISAFGYTHYVRPSRLLDQLKTSTSNVLPYTMEERGRKKPASWSRLFKSVGDLMPVSPQDAGIAKTDLIAAGFKSSTAVQVYYGTKFVGAVLMLLIALAVRGYVTKPLMKIILPIASVAMGYCLPAFVLGKLAKRRKESIRYALPDALDLMVICTEAGCGLDQAILNVSRDLKFVHPAMAEELGMVNLEVMSGKGRADALRNLARRTGEEEIKKLVAILIQTDRFGTSVAEALRTQSDFLRVRRRQEAEERAGKVGVKLVFPIFFFCLPSLLVVTAGPGMLQLFNGLLPMMNAGGPPQ